MNLSLVVRDSQRPISGTNATGGAAAISATTRLLAMEVSHDYKEEEEEKVSMQKQVLTRDVITTVRLGRSSDW